MQRFKDYILDTVCDYYDSKNIKYSREKKINTDEVVIKILREIDQFKNAVISVNVSRYDMIIMAELPFCIPVEKLPIFLEFIARANSNMLTGSFGINTRTKRLYYRVCGRWSDELLPAPDIVAIYLNTCAKTLRRYSSAITCMINTDMSALEAIATVES